MRLYPKHVLAAAGCLGPWGLCLAGNATVAGILVAAGTGLTSEPLSKSAGTFVLSVAAASFVYWAIVVATGGIGPRTRACLAFACASLQVAIIAVFVGFVREMGHPPNAASVDFLCSYPAYAGYLVSRKFGLALALALVVATAASALAWWSAMSCEAVRQGRLRRLTAAIAAAAVLGALAWPLRGSPLLAIEASAVRAVIGSFRMSRNSTDEFVLNRRRLPSVPLPIGGAVPPNILIFRMEELERTRLGLYDSTVPTTPFLRSLQIERSDEFFVFARHYSNSGATDVSLITIYTGVLPSRSGADFGHYPMVWDYPRAAGYDTFLLFPWDLSWGWVDKKIESVPGRIDVSHFFDARTSGLPIAYEINVPDDVVIDEAIRYLSARRSTRPFFGMIDLNVAHWDGMGISKLGLRSTRYAETRLSDYECAILDHDRQIERMFHYLDDRGLLDDTVIIGLADHGTPHWASVRRHRLYNYYQEVLSIPFFAFIPRRHQAALDRRYPNWRANVSRITMNVDLVPTVADLVGIAAEPAIAATLRELDGRSVFNELPSDRWVEALNTNALRTWSPEGFGLIVDGRFKYIFDNGREQLYDLAGDPGETVNRIDAKDSETMHILGQVRAYIARRPRLARIHGTPAAEADGEQSSPRPGADETR